MLARRPPMHLLAHRTSPSIACPGRLRCSAPGWLARRTAAGAAPAPEGPGPAATAPRGEPASPGHAPNRDPLAHFRAIRSTPSKAWDPAEILGDGKQVFMKLGGLQNVRNGVAVHPVVQSISRIDPLSQTFVARGLLIMKWHDESCEHLPAGAQVQAAQCTTLPPSPQLSNGDDPTWEVPTVLVARRRQDDAPGVLQGVWRWSAVFRTQLSLADFPYDHQRFAVVFWFAANGTTNEAASNRMLVPCTCNETDLKATVQQIFHLEEWDVFTPEMRWWISSTRGKIGKTAFVVEARVLRRGGYYVRMMMTMCVIASLGFTAAVLDPTQLGERLSVIVSLLLALIAFKFSVGGCLPKVTYATQFDKYMDSSILLLAGMAVSAAAVREAVRQGVFTSEEAAAFERGVALPVAAGAWLLYHVVLVMRFRRHLSSARAALGTPLVFHWHPVRSSSVPGMRFI
eukprot:TRINITY_DN66751_c0_g1_i1.p1 TRINITY_DN66751_c0_g1~~TRINITY_DN66751_c0_g1_i1.p1  ORF type:complete len:486 (+),score=110.36 TRINITY_DN66751_c0_g1_i1:93-1460(+)